MRLFRSIVSFTLATLVLLASSSFYVATHSCGGRINKIAFLEIADGCGHAKMPPCHQKMMKGCCEDEVIAHDAQDMKGEAKISLAPFALTFDFIATPVVIAEIIPSVELSPTKFFNYDSPLRSSDLVVAHAVFLI